MLPGLGDSPDVSPTQNPGPSSTPDGRTQCSGGSAQLIPQGDTDGVVPLSKGLLRHRKRTRRPRHRPVRHSPEPPDPGLHQPMSGSECPSPGRSQRRLELSPSGRKFPDLLNLSMAAPLEIPVVPDLLSQTVQCKTWTHRNPGMYNYHAWMLSGIPSKREAFLKRLPTESQSHNDLLPDPSTMGSGQNSVLGVVGRRQIRSRPLSL